MGVLSTAEIQAAVGGPLQTRPIDQNGAAVQYDAAAPMLSSRADGTPIDGYSVVGSGTALNAVLWSIDTTYAKSLYYDFIDVGTGAQAVLEGTADGSSWKPLLAYVLDQAGSPISGAGGPNARHYGTNTQGYTAVRLKLSAASSSGVVTSAVRTSSIPLPTVLTQSRLQTVQFPATATSVTGSSRSTIIKLLEFENKAAQVRYIQLASGTSYAAGNRQWTVIIAANTARTVSFPDGIPAFGFSVAATTDFAGTGLATVGDVVGYVGFSS